MTKIVLVGYDKMLYSLIEGAQKANAEILGVFRVDKTKYSKLELFFKDIFNPSKDYTIIKFEKLYDIKGNSVNSSEFYNEIKRLAPDMIVCGSWGEKFRKDILNLVPCINFHPALLPKNRGANPYFWTIFNNQKTTGLTIHYMSEKFDRGDIILQEAILIDEFETGASLKDKTTRLAKAMMFDFLKLYEKKQIQSIKQDEKHATYEHQISEKEVIIDLNKSKCDVYRHLRALYPWASAYVKVLGRYIKIKKYEFIEQDNKNQNLKNYSIVEKNKDYFILKGSDFLIKIYK